MTAESEILKQLSEVRRLCVLNFLELLEIRRHLNIPPSSQGVYDYPNHVSESIKELDDKMRVLIKQYPHLAP